VSQRNWLNASGSNATGVRRRDELSTATATATAIAAAANDKDKDHDDNHDDKDDELPALWRHEKWAPLWLRGSYLNGVLGAIPPACPAASCREVGPNSLQACQAQPSARMAQFLR